VTPEPDAGAAAAAMIAAAISDTSNDVQRSDVTRIEPAIAAAHPAAVQAVTGKRKVATRKLPMAAVIAAAVDSIKTSLRGSGSVGDGDGVDERAAGSVGKPERPVVDAVTEPSHPPRAEPRAEHQARVDCQRKGINDIGGQQPSRVGETDGVGDATSRLAQRASEVNRQWASTALQAGNVIVGGVVIGGTRTASGVCEPSPRGRRHHNVVAESDGPEPRSSDLSISPPPRRDRTRRSPTRGEAAARSSSGDRLPNNEGLSNLAHRLRDIGRYVAAVTTPAPTTQATPREHGRASSRAMAAPSTGVGEHHHAAMPLHVDDRDGHGNDGPGGGGAAPSLWAVPLNRWHRGSARVAAVQPVRAPRNHSGTVGMRISGVQPAVVSQSVSRAGSSHAASLSQRMANVGGGGATTPAARDVGE
jgi:hypothetical protein